MHNLDLKDKKLLHELDLNSRQSIQKLARKIGLSKDAVKYRMNKLQDEGIIKSYTAVIDTGKLGFLSFRLYLKLYNISPSKKKEILEFLLKKPNLMWLVEVEGKWDINNAFIFRTVAEMNAVWNELLEKYNNFIDRRELAVFANVYYFNRAYILGKERRENKIRFLSLPQEEKVDASDLKIIGLLADEARMPIIKIAKEVKISAKTVINKIKRLEEKKIITGYKPEFDLDKLGYQYYKINLSTFNTKPEKMKKLIYYIEQHPNIIYTNEVLGGADIEIEIQIESPEKLRKLIDSMLEEFSDMIRDYEILHYYKEYKLRFFPTLTKNIEEGARNEK